jgi:hypothetical protein
MIIAYKELVQLSIWLALWSPGHDFFSELLLCILSQDISIALPNDREKVEKLAKRIAGL